MSDRRRRDRPRAFPHAVAVVLLFAGCAAVGTEIDMKATESFLIGVTTRRDVEDALGSPVERLSPRAMCPPSVSRSAIEAGMKEGWFEALSELMHMEADSYEEMAEEWKLTLDEEWVEDATGSDPDFDWTRCKFVPQTSLRYIYSYARVDLMRVTKAQALVLDFDDQDVLLIYGSSEQ
jgi:hypothetical protein